jgi:uncharacterized protein (TIGR00297 family)
VPLPRLLLGLALAALVASLGYWRGALTLGGAFGALLIGTATFGLGGWAWGALVVLFFVSSSALSRYQQTRKEQFAEKFSKGARRDLGQALANGGAATLLASAHAALPHPALWVAFAGALAAVTADTWSTELGVLSSAQPRLITTGRPVEAGTSGGLTWRGTGAALAGAALIGLGGALFSLMVGEAQPASLAVAAALGGLLGSLFDSLLGATVQAIYYCPHCDKETERYPLHTCGTATRQVRGWRWLDNDWVNFLSSVVGAAVAAGLWWVI